MTAPVGALFRFFSPPPTVFASTMATCRTAYHGHLEGWGPVSTLREFDFTPCFEEGIVLSTLVVALLVLSLFRIWGIKAEASERISTLTTRSASVLTIKLVRAIVVPPLLTGDSPPNPDECRFYLRLPFQSAWQTSSTSCSDISVYLSSIFTSLSHLPYSLPSSSLTPTIIKPGHLLQPFCSFGLHT